jgi:4-amino-4-deoxy-L-arabinose transferase-like glycosyltransferase
MDLPATVTNGISPQSSSRAARRAALVVFTCVALVCFFRLGSTAITETDEGFAGTRADSFLRHGSWALSYDDVNDDRPQFRKPPLLYWVVALLFPLFGHTTWAVRLPVAAAGFLAAWLLYRLARGALGEWPALGAALLFGAVPFFVLHIRTAMLEVPLIGLMFAGLAAARLLPDTWWRPVAVGLCGGAALMIKGPGGALVAVVPVRYGLAHPRLRPRAWAQALLALTVALALPALWYLALPADQRGRMIAELFVGESAKRVKATAGAWLRLSVGAGVLAEMLRWLLPAAACGMLLALARSRRNRDLALWLGASLAVTLPLLWAYAAMVPPYARYLLPALPFLFSFAAYFALEAAGSRRSAPLLLLFALGCVVMDPADPWRWLPAAAAVGAFALAWSTRPPGRPDRQLAAGALLLAAIAAATWFSPAAWSMYLPPRFQARPELVPLVRQATALVPQNEKLIVEKGFSVHTVLFYGRRAIQTHDVWLLEGIAPHEVRYAIFQGDPLGQIPGFEQQEVARSGPWRLVRLTVDQGQRPLCGVILAKPGQRAALTNTLGLLGVGFESFGHGYLLRSVPGEVDAEVPAAQQRRKVLLPSGAVRGADAPSGPVSVGAGEAIVVEFPAPRRITGVDIRPVNRQDVPAGWTLEASVDGVWSPLARIEAPLEPFLTVAGARVRTAALPAARARFAPVSAGALRLVRTAAAPIAVDQVRVLEAPPQRQPGRDDGGARR